MTTNVRIVELFECNGKARDARYMCKKHSAKQSFYPFVRISINFLAFFNKSGNYSVDVYCGAVNWQLVW